jgi:hypothetical protein
MPEFSSLMILAFELKLKQIRQMTSLRKLQNHQSWVLGAISFEVSHGFILSAIITHLNSGCF